MDEPRVEPVLLEYLGRICTAWSTAEGHLGALLTCLLNASPLRMHVITQPMSDATLVQRVRTLCEVDIEDEKILSAVLDLLKRVDEIRSERNALVHGLWRPGPEPQTAIVNSLRLDRREIMKDELFTLPDLEEVLDRIVEINGKLNSLGRQLGYYRP
jgi:hypothetical protein